MTPAKPETKPEGPSVKRATGEGNDAKQVESAAQRPSQVQEPLRAVPPLKTFHADVERLRSWTYPDGRKHDFLADIKSDPIGHAAEKRTGHTVEELLAGCTLVMNDAEFPDGWGITWSRKLIKPEDQYLVRLLLCLAWWHSTRSNQDKETDRALRAVAAVVESRHHEIELLGKHKAEKARRQAGGAKRAKKLKATAAKDRKPVVAEWQAYEKQGRPDRHTWVGLIVRKHSIPERTVRRYLKQAGCR